MNDLLYKVVEYADIVNFEKGLNFMDTEGYDFVTFTRGINGHITAIYKQK